jgi:hypothetical protein
MDVVDALSCCPRVSSPVALSEVQPVFRRKFSSVYDVLRHVTFDEPALRSVLYQALPADCQVVAGYAWYVLDATFLERAAAKTLEDRRCVRQGAEAAVQYGHKYSWLVRLVAAGTSWVAPLDVERVTSQQTETQVGRLQVKRLVEQAGHEVAVIADGSYGNAQFLRVLDEVPQVALLVRLRHNRTLYGAPPPRQPHQRGATRKHGAPFRLSSPPRAPEEQAAQVLPDGRTLRVSVWHHLHLRDLAGHPGTLVRLELLRPDGTPCYKRPVFVFWTGRAEVPGLVLAQMYLGRFGIEHAFRFFKQQLGLNRCRSTHLPSLQHWMWCCVLAYWQLLLLRQEEVPRPAWYPRRPNQPLPGNTPRLVQRVASQFLAPLGIPAKPPKPAGKGSGRPKGYHPAPRTRYPTVPTRRQQAAAAAKSA